MAKRGRKPRTTLTPGVDKLTLNAKVDQQLLLEFNDFSQKPDHWRGTRDGLLEFVLKEFLGSSRKPPQRAASTVEDNEIREDVAVAVGGVRRAVDVIASARRHAEAIVEVTTIVRDSEPKEPT